MTKRERQANDGATVPTMSPPSAQVELCASDAPSANVSASPAFVKQLHLAHPIKQIAILTHAARRGKLCDPFAPFPVGVERNGQIEFERWNFLSRLASGKKNALSPSPVASIEIFDKQLDVRQRHAVAVALHTPDVAVLAGLPGTGKSRVVAEVVVQAVRRGERVLFLAPDGAAVDHVLHRLSECDDVWAYRCSAGGQRESLSKAVRLMTGPSQRERYRQLAEQGAGAIQVEAENHRRRRDQDEKLWPIIRETAERLTELREEIGRATAREAKLRGEVVMELAEAEAGRKHRRPLLSALETALTEAENEFGQIEERRKSVILLKGQIQSESDTIRGELDKLHPLADAKQNGRWWTWNWWLATFRGKVLQTRDELRTQESEKTAQLQENEKLERDLIAEKQSLTQRIRNEVVVAETQRRVEKLMNKLDALRLEETELASQWLGQVMQLEKSVRPKAENCAAVDEAVAAWRTLSNPDENCRCAREWASQVGRSAELVEKRFADWANVVAGPVADFVKDSHFQTVAPKFDLLILEEADRLSESDFLQLGRWARRWVLVGEAHWEGVRTIDSPGNKSQAGQTPVSLLHQMWQHFHPDPRRLPFRWSRHKGKLRCRLRSIVAHERQWLETETVADSPDIELRIVNPPRDDPFLAEVVFPDSTTIADAKLFLYRETDELAIQSDSPAHHWQEENKSWSLHFSTASCDEQTCIELEPGVCEWVDLATTRTMRIVFDKESGWRRGDVDEWLSNRLPLHDLQRTAYLSVPYRMETTLSNVLSDLLFDGGYVSSQNGVVRSKEYGAGSQPVEFVPIPPLQRQRSTRRDGDAPALLPSEGAGLEVDLKNSRSADRLPKDLAADLPKHGFINVQEAHAVVRRLEQLANTDTGESIVVLALYAAQAELIRRLASRSSILKSSSLSVEIGLPQDFRHRESAVVLVSLTRSHTRRAVAFGDNESHMVLAMTRARNRLILFGDPGTLVRRSQWNGGNLDRMDAASAAREKKVVTDLVRYLNGQGRFPHAFHVCDEQR